MYSYEGVYVVHISDLRCFLVGFFPTFYFDLIQIEKAFKINHVTSIHNIILTHIRYIILTHIRNISLTHTTNSNQIVLTIDKPK